MGFTTQVVPTLIPLRTASSLTSLTLTPPSGALGYGEPLKFKAKLTVPGAKAGLPLYLDGDPLTAFDGAGNASFTLTPLPGDYQHVASFPGNIALYALDAPFSFTVNPAPTKLQMSVAAGQTLNVNLQLAKTFLPDMQSTVDGVVTLYDGSVAIDSGALAGTTVWSVDLTGTTPGVHQYTADYSGSTLFAPATATLNFNYVPAAATSVALFSSDELHMGRTVTLTAAITAATSTGTIQGSVQFYADGSLLGTGKVAGGKATIPYVVPTNAGDTITFSAQYQAASNHLNSVSASLSLPVMQKDVIDVLAVMSTQVYANQSSAIARFNQQIDLANQAFANSNIPLELRVTAIGGTTYSESGNLSTDLDRLDTPGDGALEEVFGLRNGYGADLVVLLVSDSQFDHNSFIEGIATQLSDPKSSTRADHAFMVININAPNNDYVLAHEVGHTLGAGHAASDPDHGGAAPYAHGYRFTGTDGILYHDIMAYYPGTLVAGFSNPALTSHGVPFGNAKTADNARVIREDAPIVAAYRTAKPVGGIDTASATQISGYALDPRVDGPMMVRVDIDNQARATFAANGPYGSITHGYTYTLPLLGRGRHTLTLLGLDIYTGAWVPLASKVITA
ncbi:MAG TPA: Ig-like domain repeat protein [Phycisphaerae bacterium]|nr:Ig-like domain repeat protein [Phycisphaerae bacterium]